jgi:integrase
MSRPRLAIATFGEFTYQSAKTGRIRARALFRDWDGATRQVQASAPTRAAAERALKAKLADRAGHSPLEHTLTADSSFAQLGEYWLADLEMEGRTAYRQDHPKTARSRRTVVIPEFTAEAVKRRLAKLEGNSPDALLFQSRNGTPLATNNVRRQLRRVLGLAGIEGVTPHSFRRAVATAVKDAANVELAAELLGHADPKITIQHYVRRSEMVNPLTASVLEEQFTPEWRRSK